MASAAHTAEKNEIPKYEGSNCVSDCHVASGTASFMPRNKIEAIQVLAVKVRSDQTMLLLLNYFEYDLYYK